MDIEGTQTDTHRQTGIERLKDRETERQSYTVRQTETHRDRQRDT